MKAYIFPPYFFVWRFLLPKFCNLNRSSQKWDGLQSVRSMNPGRQAQ